MNWNVRIGINPISWMNDDLPALGGETPLETALSEGRQIGYAGFELGNKFPKDGPGLQAKLAEFGLACVSGWYSGLLAEHGVEAEIARCHDHMAKLQFNDAKPSWLSTLAFTTSRTMPCLENGNTVFASNPKLLPWASAPQTWLKPFARPTMARR